MSRNSGKLMNDWQTYVAEVGPDKQDMPISLSLTADGAWLIKFSLTSRLVRFNEYDAAERFLKECIPQRFQK